MKNVLKYVLFLLTIFIVVVGFVLTKEKAYPVVSYELMHRTDSTSFLTHEFARTNKRSLGGGHLFKTIFEGDVVQMILQPEQDSIVINNVTQKHLTRFKLPFQSFTPISSIYFHNYDTIIVIVEREFLIEMRKFEFSIPDIIIMDTNGQVIGDYSLDDIPYFYHGPLDTATMLSAMPVYGKRLLKNKFYLPLLIYSPRINTVAANQINMLAELDLETGHIEMLNVKLPKETIANKYAKKVLEQDLDFQIVNDDTFLISFFHSSDVFAYSLRADSLVRVFSEPDVLFVNPYQGNVDNMNRTTFFAPKYCRTFNGFTRNLIVANHNDHRPFMASMVFDSNFSLIGYSLEDSVYSQISTNLFGESVVMDKTQNYLGELVSIEGMRLATQKEIDREFLKFKKLEPISRTKEHMITDFTYSERLRMYGQRMGIQANSKTVFLYTDQLCINCLNHFMMQYQKYAGSEEFTRVEFVFYGSSIQSIQKVLINYDIRLPNPSFFIDTNNEYLNYFSEKEILGKPILVNFANKELKIEKYTPDDLVEKFQDFLQD